MPADGEDRDEQELHHQHEEHGREEAGIEHRLARGRPADLRHRHLQQRQDIVESEDADGEDAQDQHEPDAEELAAAVAHQPCGGQGGLADEDPPAHARPLELLPRIRRAAAALSAAPVIGRPMTRKSAPSAEASPGVMIRF